MKSESSEEFIKNTERLVSPISVGSLHFIQPFNQMLPKKVQSALIRSSSKKMPFMGFIVEPYATFLCYEITNLEKAKSLLPENFKLVKTKIFTDDESKYYCIFGCLRLHTSAFWGCRAEFYIIAEDEKTGLLSWIIVDYDSDTISYDNKNGLRSPSSSKAVVATSYDGKVIVDIKRDGSAQELTFDATLEGAQKTKLDQRLWLEGNLSIGYGQVLSNGGDAGIFSLRFKPAEVTEALSIAKSKLSLKQNTWQPGLFKKEPSQVVCFPYAQHFVSDSPGSASNIKTKDELIKATNEINFKDVKVFSAKQFQHAMIATSTILLAAVAILTIALIFK